MDLVALDGPLALSVKHARILLACMVRFVLLQRWMPRTTARTFAWNFSVCQRQQSSSSPMVKAYHTRSVPPRMSLDAVLILSFQDYLVTAQRYVPACVKKPTSQAMTRVDTGDSGIADMMSNLDLNKLTWAPTLSMATPQRITSTSPENQGPCGWYFSPTGRTRIPHAGAALPTTPAHFGCLQNYGMLNMNGQQPYTPRNIGFPGVIGERSQMFSPNSGSWSSSANRVGPSTTFGGRGAHHEGGSGQHNIVSIEKIANGTDVRTTVSSFPVPTPCKI